MNDPTHSDLKNDLASLRIDRERPRARRWVWPLAVLLLLAAVGGFAAWRAREALAVTEVETVRPTVVRTTVAGGTPVLTASGYVVARRQAVVSAKIQGRLAELRVEEGSRVRWGEVLARLENEDYRAQVERSRAQVRSAEARIEQGSAQVQRASADLAEYRRQLQVAENLAREEVLPVDQLEAARSRVKVAEAVLEQARADRQQARAEVERARADLTFNGALLDNTVIRAPFDGTVVKKMAEVGESVAPIPPGVNLSVSSGAVVALADLDTLEVEADVGEANVARLKEGQPAEVTVEAFPDRTYRSVLRQIIPTADRTRATVQVKVTILNKDQDLKPEMSARVTFLETAVTQAAGGSDQNAAPLVSVPRDAVVTRNGATQVFEVVRDKVRARPIVSAGTQGDQIVVKEGLAGDETIVLRPPQTLKDGDAVRVKGKS